MSKDLWFANMERRMAELEDEGYPTDEAYNRASEEAWDLTRDQLADKADQLRQQQKEVR